MGAWGSKDPGGRDKVVLITGCSEGGIGHALAIEFSKRGCTVIATARSLKSLKSLQEHKIQCATLDVCDESSMTAVVSNILEKFGRIDILVNNAGVPCLSPVAKVPMEKLELTFKTNVFGPISLIQKVVPGMVAQGHGKIVNVGSIAAYASGPWMSGYTASKSALHALTDSMRVELKPFNIQVVLVTPGAITSKIGDHALTSVDLSNLDMYKPFEESIRYRAMLSQGPRSTPASEFAHKTVAKILLPKPPATFAYGGLTWILCSLYYAPAWLRDWFFERLIKLNKVQLVKPAA